MNGVLTVLVRPEGQWVFWQDQEHQKLVSLRGQRLDKKYCVSFKTFLA